jgi:hypothetical protein
MEHPARRACLEEGGEFIFHAALFFLYGESRVKYTGVHQNEVTSPTTATRAMRRERLRGQNPGQPATTFFVPSRPGTADLAGDARPRTSPATLGFQPWLSLYVARRQVCGIKRPRRTLPGLETAVFGG